MRSSGDAHVAATTRCDHARSAHPFHAMHGVRAIVRPVRIALDGLDNAIASGRVVPNVRFGRGCVGVVEKLEGDKGLEAPPTGSDGFSVLAAQWKGKRVVIAPAIGCGACDLCAGGLAVHCRHAQENGQAVGRAGGAAEPDVFALRAVPLHALAIVPKQLDEDHAACAALVAAALHVEHFIPTRGNPLITVLGDGPLALLTGQVLRTHHDSVRVLGIDQCKLALCAKWQIKHRLADEAGRRGDQDVVVDCTGAPAGFATALEFVRPRGVIVMKSVWRADCPTASAIDMQRIARDEIRIAGSWHGEMQRALRMIEAHEVDLASLLSRRQRFESVDQTTSMLARPERMVLLLEECSRGGRSGQG